MINGRSRTALIGAGCAAIAMLIGLGAWQLQRLEWKQRQIALLEHALTAEPVSIGDLEAAIEHGYDVDWLKVQATGSYRHDLERHVYALRGGAPGWRVVTPLVAPGDYIVLVDRGFVPDRLKEPSSRPGSQDTPDPVTVTGLARVRTGAASYFTPGDRPAENRWYAFDIARLVASMPADLSHVAPDGYARYISVVLQADRGGEPGRGDWPVSDPVNPALKNDHLNYALTWFSLAVALAVILLILLRRGPRRPAAKGRP